MMDQYYRNQSKKGPEGGPIPNQPDLNSCNHDIEFGFNTDRLQLSIFQLLRKVFEFVTKFL